MGCKEGTKENRHQGVMPQRAQMFLNSTLRGKPCALCLWLQPLFNRFIEVFMPEAPGWRPRHLSYRRVKMCIRDRKYCVRFFKQP